MARRPSACAPSAARLGVVPGALYRHVRSKEQLYDLILDGVLAEVDCRADPALPWTAQVAMLAHRLRAVLETIPASPPCSRPATLRPASLALAEAFLAPLHAAGLSGRQAALAFRLIYDYTLGFALADPASPAEQRLRDSAARQQLHAFLRSLPASSFPTLAALGSTPGPTTASSASPPASTLSSAACRQPSASSGVSRPKSSPPGPGLAG